MKSILTYLCLILTLVACKNQVDTQEEVLNFVNNPKTGLYKETTTSGIKVTASVKAPGLLAEQDLQSMENLDNATADSVTVYYSNNVYMNIGFSKNNKPILQQVNTPGDYSKLIHILSFQMRDYVYLLTNTDTIPPMDYQLAQFYGMELENSLLFSFSGEKVYDNRKFELVIEDFGIGIHPIHFEFKVRDIKKIPHLKQ